MTLVAVSASYGAGGSEVAPAVAELLGVPFVDRAIPFAVAERLAVPLEEALANDEDETPGLLERLLSGFVGHDVGAPVPPPVHSASRDAFRTATEAVLRRQAATGAGVILGRAGALVLGDDPRVLRVRLDGPRAARIAQAMRISGIDEKTAARRLQQTDRAHAAYVRRFYGADIDDASLYHLVLDSTAIALEACAEVIAIAARSIVGAGARSSSDG